MFKTLIILAVTILTLSACENSTEKSSGPESKATQTPAVTQTTELTTTQPKTPDEQPLAEPFDLLNQPGRLQRFETIAGAMTVWRHYADQKPALLLLTGSPALLPPPVELIDQIDD